MIIRHYHSGLSADEMAFVARLPYLRHLLLEAHPIDDRGVEHLSALMRLEILNLANTAITDESLAVIARLPRLKSLDVSRTDITDEGPLRLSALSSLEVLYFEMTNNSEAGVGELQRRLPGCQIHR